MSINPQAHVRMQAVWQKHVTNSVSKTINLPNEATIEDVKESFKSAWSTGCKAVTVYRDGSKSMQVLETGSTTVGEDKQNLLVPRQRPGSIKGLTDRVRTGHGNMYVTVNFDEKSHPFEVFTTLGKAGGCDSANLEAISRLISLTLRSGIDPSQVVQQLKGITCCPIWDNGISIRSTPDAVAMILDRHLTANGQVLECTDGDLQDGLSAQLGLFHSSNDKTNGNRHTSSTGARCPECSGFLIHQEGCLSCRDCGYTKCD